MPRPAEDLPLTPPTISSVLPEELEGIKVTAKTDKLVYKTGDREGKVTLSIRNNGLKALEATSMTFGYEIIAKDGGPGFSVVNHDIYTLDRPFSVKPSEEISIDFNWPVVVTTEDGYRDAMPGEYTARVIIYSPIKVAAETDLEVIR